ncbi:MAG TPA: hypothetical protein VFW73_10955, partial [Lacipirellulaceae bacterium]|nr:hypothetical protein [Lacipirellulaceae bacterium]
MAFSAAALYTVAGGELSKAAEQDAAPLAHSAIQYRRVYVPADKVEAWPRGGEKFIPVESRDFDASIRSADKAASNPSETATITAARYTASLASDGSLRGQGSWTIDLTREKPAFLSLGTTSLILRNALWKDSPREPAQLGLWGRSGNVPKRFGLVVPQSGILLFDWHIQTRATGDQIDVPWNVPMATSVRLVLDLPEDKQPQIDNGVVLESTRLMPADRSTNKPSRRWVIAISPSRGESLRIVDANGKMPETASQMALREDVGYRLSPRGLLINATWQLDAPAGQKRELTVPVPPGLQITALKANNHDLPWRILHDSSSPTDRALIELPKKPGSEKLQVRLQAWQPLLLDRPWRLPRLRPDGVFWCAGNFEIFVDAAYQLDRLEPTDCIETGVKTKAAASDSPETHLFAAYAPSAEVEISLSQRSPDVLIHAASSLSLADPDLKGRLVAQWTVAHGAIHQLIGTLAAGWVIETVETIPADAMTDWFIDRQGSNRTIEIQLSRAASAARNVSVIVTGRLQRFSLTEPIPAETMRMVDWQGAHTARHLLTFQSNAPYAAEPVGKLQELSPSDLDNQDRALLEPAADDRVFDITNTSKNAAVQLTVRRGQYAADIDMQLSFESGVLAQNYHLTITPASDPIDRMVVYSTSTLGDSVRWTDAASGAPLNVERIVPGDAQRAGLPKEGEAWLLRFAQPTSRPIDIVASIQRKPTPSERALVPLLSLPEATEQHGKILVRCRKTDSLWLEPIRLRAIPPPIQARGTSELDSTSTVCAAFEYQPADCRDPVRSPKLWASVTARPLISPLVARRIQLESYFWPDGRASHRATYLLENHGATQANVTLPSGSRLVSASLDGQPINITAPIGEEAPAAINLPPNARSTKLSVCVETDGPPLATGGELSAPLVLSQVPFLIGDWTIWMPKEYSASGQNGAAVDSKFNWRQRVFGLLGRPADVRPFNPLRLAEGATWISGAAEGKVIASQPDTTTAQTNTSQSEPNKSLATSELAAAQPTIGWREYHESFMAGGPAPLVVTHTPATATWSVVLFVACYLGGRWLRRTRGEYFVGGLAFAAGAALLLPSGYAHLAAGAVLGLLLSLITDWTRSSTKVEKPALPSSVKTAIAGALAATIAAGLTRMSCAQTSPAATPTKSANATHVYRVLIPTDAKGNVTGSKYFISEPFLRALIAAGSKAVPDPGEWLLRDEVFSGELQSDPSQSDDVVPGRWTAMFSIETLSRDVKVVLPLDRENADWNTIAMLDGVPTPIDWHYRGGGCAIHIPEPGRYSLAISCRPKTTIADGVKQMALSIPPIQGAHFSLRLPESTPAATIAHASLLPPMSAAADLTGELERVDKLSVKWASSSTTENGKQRATITELRWLDIKPTDTELTIKYVVDGAGQMPDSMTVSYDDRWKLLANDGTKFSDKLDPNSSTRRLVRVAIPTQQSDRREIQLRWRLD